MHSNGRCNKRFNAWLHDVSISTDLKVKTMTSKWTKIIKNNRGYWKMYYNSSKSWHYPYFVEYLGTEY